MTETTAITPDDLAHPERFRRKALERYAEEEWGIDRASDLKRYPNRASLAQAVLRRMAEVPSDADETFTPRTYWAVGPPAIVFAPQLKHPRLGIGRSIKPTRDGRYVAVTPTQDELIRSELVAKGSAFPEDPPELIESVPKEDRGCERCNFYPNSISAAARHHRACHPAPQ